MYNTVHNPSDDAKVTVATEFEPRYSAHSLQFRLVQSSRGFLRGEGGETDSASICNADCDPGQGHNRGLARHLLKFEIRWSNPSWGVAKFFAQVRNYYEWYA